MGREPMGTTLEAVHDERSLRKAGLPEDRVPLIRGYSVTFERGLDEMHDLTIAPHDAQQEAAA